MTRTAPWIALLLTSAVSQPVFAQASDTAAPLPTVESASSAQEVPPPALLTESQKQALGHYERGLERYDDGEFALALVEFERAYAVRPSYKLLFNIGQVHYQLGRFAKARRALERYLAEGKGEIGGERRAQVQEDLRALALRTAYVVVKVNVSRAEVSIDDEDVGVSPLEVRLLVDAGNRRIVAGKAGYSFARRSVSLAGGEVAVVELKLVNLAPKVMTKPANTPAIVAWISTGVLAASAIGTGVATVLADSEYDKMRREPIRLTPSAGKRELDRQADSVQTLAVATDILAGAAAISGGVALYFTLRGTSARETPPPRASVGLVGREARLAIRF